MVILVSGGHDSLLCAYRARHLDPLCVFVEYGQPAQERELEHARAFCGEHNLRLKVVQALGISLGGMADPKGHAIVPHRNAILLTIAANAATPGRPVVIGCNADDASAYPDCRQGFIEAVGRALGVEVQTPLSNSSKREILEASRKAGINAWSCYHGGASPCGECSSCLEGT